MCSKIRCQSLVDPPQFLFFNEINYEFYIDRKITSIHNYPWIRMYTLAVLLIDVSGDGLYLGVSLKTVLSQLPAATRLLEPAVEKTL